MLDGESLFGPLCFGKACEMGECRRTHRQYGEDGLCMDRENGRYRGTCIPVHRRRKLYYEGR